MSDWIEYNQAIFALKEEAEDLELTRVIVKKFWAKGWINWTRLFH